MATGFSGLGLGELGAESKYVGKSNTFYKPQEVRNEKGEVQVPLLQGLRQMAGKYLGDKYLTPAVNYLENKFTPAVPPPTVPVGVSPATLAPSQASITVALPADADHPELQGILAVDPYAQIKP
jgi:hypothetical protein